MIIDVTPAGAAPQRWSPLVAAAPVVPANDLAQLATGPNPTLLMISAHPDDETIGCGRLASWWSRRVGRVTAIVATAGEACFDHVIDRPSGLGALRLREWERALAELGVRPGGCLGLRDGHVGADRRELADLVEAALLDQVAAGPVVLASPWRGDPHPDHAACGSVVAEIAVRHAVPILEYPVWMTYWSDPRAASAPRESLRRIVVDDAAELAHQRACRCFVSQLEPIASGLGPVVPPAMLSHHDQQLLIMERP